MEVMAMAMMMMVMMTTKNGATKKGVTIKNADVVKDHPVMEPQVDLRADPLVDLQVDLQAGLQEDPEPMGPTANTWNFQSAEMTGLVIPTQR
jgi:hypothetical protein